MPAAALLRGGIEKDWRSRAVVARVLPGRFGATAEFYRANQLFDLGLRDHPRSQYPRRGSGQRYDRAFDTDCARSAIEDHVGQTFRHVLRSGWREFSEPVGARRGDWDLRSFD